jgi:Tripartite tricarboxylate transporter TctB family
MTAPERRETPAVPAPGAVQPRTSTATSARPGGGEAVAELVITVVLLALFGWAFLDAADWSFRAALFPRIVTGAGFAFCAIKLVQDLFALRRGRTVGTPTPELDHAPVPDGGTHEDEDVAEEDVEYVFATAGARNWSIALAWVAGFFVLLYVAGLFVTAPVFSLLYLRFGGRQSWRVSVIYAVVIGVVLYLAFEVALGIATPPGLFLD